MTKEIDGKKSRIGEVRGATRPEGVQKTGAVSEVERAQKTAPVSGVRPVGAAAGIRTAAAITAARRAQIFELIHEEADKLFANKTLPPEHRQIVEQAVKMTIDAAIGPDAEEDKNKPGKDKP